MSGPITKHHWDALAADIYARNGYRSYGIDPMSILAMLNVIVPQVLQWVADCKRLRDDEVQPAVAAMNARNPAQTKRRTATQCAKLRRKQGEQFCKEFNVPRSNRRAIICVWTCQASRLHALRQPGTGTTARPFRVRRGQLLVTRWRIVFGGRRTGMTGFARRQHIGSNAGLQTRCFLSYCGVQVWNGGGALLCGQRAGFTRQARG